MRRTQGHYSARRAAVLLAVACLAAAAASHPVSACSICRCGDPAFNALGLNIYSSNSFRIAFDWDRFDKTQGSSEGGDGARESVLENRFTAAISYTPSDALTLVARVPYTTRELTTEPGAGDATALDEDHGERTTGRGLSDPELYALVRVWAAPFVGGLGRRAWVGVQLGVKTPWGENHLRENGERLDEHVQPGTGSTDWIAGVAGVYVLDPVSSLFGSLQHRGTGSNDFGYRYGTVSLANLGYERKLGSRVDAVLELNGRHAGKERVDADGALDPNTGGRLLYLSPKVVLNLSGSLVARVSAQIPVAKSLNGSQTERTVWGVGLTYVFGG